MMRKQWIFFGLFILAAAALFSCRSSQQEEPAAEQAVYGAAKVKAVKAVRQKISEKLFYTGQIEARIRLAVNPDIGGKIAEIYVESGDRVKKGQVLAELDTRAVRLQLEQAKAAQAVAQANSNDARVNMDRMKRLKSENAVSDQQYEKISLAFEAAESQLQQAKAVVNLAEYSLDVSIMKAPFNGVIAARNAEVGDMVNPLMGGLSASSGVLVLMDYSQVKIEVDVSPQDVARIQKDQPAWITVSTFPGRQFEGRVTVVNLAADPVSRKFKIEVQVNNPEGILRPNTFGEVSLEVNSHENALVVPQKSLIERRFLFLAEGTSAVKREVEIGLQSSEWIEILRGINEGDLVIVEGNYGLDDGTQISVEVLQ